MLSCDRCTTIIEMRWGLRPRSLVTILKRRGDCEVKLSVGCEGNALCNGTPSDERLIMSGKGQSDPLGGETLTLTLV